MARQHKQIRALTFPSAVAHFHERFVRHESAYLPCNIQGGYMRVQVVYPVNGDGNSTSHNMTPGRVRNAI